MDRNIQLKARLILNFEIEALTGLHIGGAFEGIAIGGVDKTIIRDPLTNQPYIPGSSLRGKTRSLIEKYTNKPQNQRINQGYIHSCQAEEWDAYQTCQVCRVYGLPGERIFATPARLVVRDLHMSKESATVFDRLNTELPYTEVKVEVAIDRVTSQANPRQLERVPAGAIFSGGEMIYSLYAGRFEDDQKHPFSIDPLVDLEYFDTVLMGLQLLEDDYLGGAGARGSGKVQFKKIKLGLKAGERYPSEPLELGEFGSVSELRTAWSNLKLTVSVKI